VKVSLGIICDSLANPSAEYRAWLLAQQASGMVEFWNHGWDHKQWAEGGKSISEFGGSAYAHQKEHFVKAQEAMEKVLGAAPVAFGTPFNSFGPDTSRVLSEDPRIRLLFCYKDPRIKNVIPALMSLRGEPDGTGKPNAAKFAEEYTKKKGQLAFAAIQFHPAAFGNAQLDEYGKTLDLLLADGWTFMLPREYGAWIAKRE
jgi:peptidoglycan/xylan/chitin deacetylase (PgdA/CDA1 family)